MERLVQHEVSIELDGERIVGHFTLERRGRWDRLTVWYRGRSLTHPEIAHEADPWSTEAVAEGLLRRLAVGEGMPRRSCRCRPAGGTYRGGARR